MHVIVVGCGRVGSEVALNLASTEHDVIVIDRKVESFRRLGDDFKGTTMVGVGFDRDVLTEAGISPNCAVAAVTSGDNSNILIARVARETFGVKHVVARIYDPRRASIYERLGIANSRLRCMDKCSRAAPPAGIGVHARLDRPVGQVHHHRAPRARCCSGGVDRRGRVIVPRSSGGARPSRRRHHPIACHLASGG